MNTLSAELKCKIFANLPLADRLSIRGVSIEWSILSRNKEVWQNFQVLCNGDLVDIGSFNQISDRKLDLLLSYFGPYVKELRFIESGEFPWGAGCPFIHLLPVILNRIGTQIQHVQLCAHDRQLFRALVEISRCLPSTLKSLSIDTHHVPSEQTLNALHHLLGRCKSLEFLHTLIPIQIGRLSMLGVHLPVTLKYLEVPSLHYSNEQNETKLVEHLANHCPKLQSFCGAVHPMEQETVAKFKSLKFISHNYDPSSVLFRNLRGVHLFDLHTETLQKLLHNSPNLEHISWHKSFYWKYEKGDFEKVALMLVKFPMLTSIFCNSTRCLNNLIAKGNLKYIQVKLLNGWKAGDLQLFLASLHQCPQLRYLRIDPTTLMADDLLILSSALFESGRTEKLVVHVNHLYPALIEVFPQIIFIIGENTDHPFKNYVPNQIKFETFKSIPSFVRSL